MGTLKKIFGKSTSLVKAVSGIPVANIYKVSGELWPTGTGGMFTFKITKAAAGNFTLPIYGAGNGAGYSQNFTVDWGDLSTSTITSYDDSDRVHAYAAAGTYTIRMTGICEYLRFGFYGDLGTEIIELVSFTGDMGFKHLNFCNCFNIVTICSLGTMSSLIAATNMFNTDYTAGTSKLTAIPSGMFDGCPDDIDFGGVFRGCEKITSIPANLFDNQVNTLSFNSAFAYCLDLTAIPTDLFRYNTEVIQFPSCFWNCNSLTVIPDYLFRYNTKAYHFMGVFGSTTPTRRPFSQLQLNPLIFCAIGDEDTRFLDMNAYFFGAFSAVAWSGVQGTAPDLWNYDYGTGTVTKTKCFMGQSSSSVDNYGDIPAAWK